MVRVEEPQPGVFWLVYRSDKMGTNYTVKNAPLFREIVAGGLDEGLPRTTFKRLAPPGKE
jgi:hypothetical protein